MPSRRRPAAVLLAATGAAQSPIASASTAPAVVPHVSVQFDLAKGQTPENITLAPDGDTNVTFAAGRQVAVVSRDGATGSWPPCPSPPTAASTPRCWASR
ncbi:hypothetical protein ACF08B_02170 [Streptomyces sp. NPDC015139]|uniref:hypothetical protein n=1 Tax=Streptomyces sp. NPDC015139 TaxID=3364942 RepID=UPI0037012ABE